MRTWRLVKWGSVYVWPPACVRSFFLWNQVKKHLPSLSVNDTIHLGSDCWFKTSSPSTPSQTSSSAPDLSPWTSHPHDHCKLLHLISYRSLSNPLSLYGLHYTYSCLHPPELHVFRLWCGCFFVCFLIFLPSSDLHPVRQNEEDMTYSSSSKFNMADHQIRRPTTALSSKQSITCRANTCITWSRTSFCTHSEHISPCLSLFHRFSFEIISDSFSLWVIPDSEL